mgnify:CR=1 FL=1
MTNLATAEMNPDQQAITMDRPATPDDWETAIAQLLDELSLVQDELLKALTSKRDVLVAGDVKRLEEVQQHEQELGERLQACHDRRAELLAQATSQGLPGESIAELASALPATDRQQLGQTVQRVSARTRLLRHHSLANWVLAQRSLLHLSQLLEILATGGKTKPTYSKEESPHARGNLVDHAA